MLKKLLTTSLATGIAIGTWTLPALALKKNTVLIYKREAKSGKTLSKTLSTLVYAGNRVRSENFINPKKPKESDGRNVFIYDFKAAELFNYAHSAVNKSAVKYKNARPEKIHLFELSPHFVLRGNMVQDSKNIREYIKRKGGKLLQKKNPLAAKKSKEKSDQMTIALPKMIPLTEEINGYVSEIWEWQSAIYKIKTWVSKDLDFITKVHLESPIGYMSYELVKASEIELSDDELVVPKEYKLETEPLWGAMRDFWPKK